MKSCGKNGTKACRCGYNALAILAAIVAALCYAPDTTIFTLTFCLQAYTKWDYRQSQFYLDYMSARWEKLPLIDAEPIPELHIENFTREELLRISNNFRIPVVIRGGIRDTVAVREWNEAYFSANYGNESLLVREIVDGFKIRFQQRTFDEFFIMKNKGRNVSVVASSGIFGRNPSFKEDLRSPVEDDLVGPRGEGISAYQFFITPTGRSWYHSEMGNSVFRMVQGRKLWTVVSPDYNFWLCPDPLISGTSVTPFCVFERENRELWMDRIPRLSAVLEPGDILINAGWWWHDVQSLGAPTDDNIAVAGRMKTLQATFLNSPVLTFHAVLTSIIKRVNHGEGEVFETNLEDNIVTSWVRNCYAEGRDDCVTDV